MKKWTKVLSAFVVATVMSTGIAAMTGCDGCDDEHEHTYAAQWSTDKNGHWKESECDHDPTEKEPHEDRFTNGSELEVPDGFCDVCDYNLKLTVTFNSDGGSAVASQQIVKGNKATEPDDPSKAGHTFAGWFAEGASTAFDFDTAITTSITLKAHWTPDDTPAGTVTVTFDSDGGSAVDSQSFNKGGKATEPATNPEKAGHTFAGWFKEGEDTAFDFDTVINESITLKAHWTPNGSTVDKVTVTFTVKEGVTGATGMPEAQEINKGGKAERPETNPALAGHTFDDWYADEECETLFDFTNTVINVNTEIYANFIPEGQPIVEKVTVTFVIGDDTTTQKVVKGGKATKIADPDVANHTFDGWYTDDTYATEFDFDTVINVATYIYAKLTPNSVTPAKEYWTVTVDLNDGSEPTEEQVEKGQKLTGVDEPTRNGFRFAGWKVDGEDWTMDTAVTANITIVAQWEQLSPYEAFVAQGNILYSSDFTDTEEEILNKNTIHGYEDTVNAYGKWVGTISGDGEFDADNTLTISGGYLNLIDTSAKTTTANLNVAPVYASLVEVKAVIQLSKLAGSWSVFTLMSPYSSGEYLLDLRTNGDKQISCRVRSYNETTKEYSDGALATGGFVYAENKDIVIEATVNLANGEVSVTLSQEGKTSKTFTATIDATGYSEMGMPLAFSGVKLMTAGSDSRSIKVDWLGARVVSEDTEAMKEFVLGMFEAEYGDLDPDDYTQQLEKLEKAYADGVAAIEAATTNAEVLEAYMNAQHELSDVKSDAELAAEAAVGDALETLAALKEEHKDNYTITKDSEDDDYANKEEFDRLFEEAERELEHPNSVDQVQRVVDNVREALEDEHRWPLTDAAVLTNYRQHLVSEVNKYAFENGYTANMETVNTEIIQPLEEDLADLTTKSEMKARYAEAIEAFGDITGDAELLAQAKDTAKTAIDQVANPAIDSLDGDTPFGAELIAEINAVRSEANEAIDAATEIYVVETIQANAVNEINSLRQYTSLSAAIEAMKTELENYVEMFADGEFAEDTEVSSAIEEVYVNGSDELDEVTTLSAARDKLKELKDEVDAIVAEARFERNKAEQLEHFEEEALNMLEQAELESKFLEDEFIDLADEWYDKLSAAESMEEFEALRSEAMEALNAFIVGRFERIFTVTFTNANGSVSVKFGETIDTSKIHVTGFTVTAVDHDGPVYGDMEVEITEMEAIDVVGAVNWAADKNVTLPENGGDVVDNEFFTISQAAKSAWLEASFATGYTVGWQSANFKEDGNDVPIILTIKENLTSLKLHVGLADSAWDSNRKGLISFVKDGVTIATAGDKDTATKHFAEVTLENLMCGDVITIYAHDLSNGSRIYIFDAEAKMDYSAVPKTVAITWGNAEEPTMYSHLESVTAPKNDPTGEGTFKYWYYLDEEENEVVFDKNAENIFPAMTEIHMLAKFAEANVFITYINGEDEEVVPYALGDDETGIEKKVLTGSSTEKFIGWFEANSDEEFDYASVAAGDTVTLYAKWHDLGKKVTEETKQYDYTTISALPTSDNLITYTFDGETIESGKGIKTGNEAKGSRNIKVTLPEAGGKIIVEFNNAGTNVRNGFIDTTANKTNTGSTYGNVTIGKSTAKPTEAQPKVTLTSAKLAGGDWYVNWTGKDILIESITVIYYEESEVEYTGISGTPVASYTAGDALELDLTGLSLATTTDYTVALTTIKDDLTIDIENEADFVAGTAGTYDVTITYGSHTKMSYQVTVE